MSAATLIALGLGLLVLVLLAGGAWFLRWLQNEQQELRSRVAALESSEPAAASPAIPLLEEVSGRHIAGNEHPAIGDRAPDVTFLEITGKTGRLADLEGEDTTVVFWDGTSEDCRRILPGLREVEGRPRHVLPGLLLIVPGASSGNQIVNLRSPMVIDRDGSAARAFGISAWPSAVMVDARGDIASDLVHGPDQVLALASGGLRHHRALVPWAGLDFEVTRHITHPRPETESVAERAVQLALERGARVLLDIGTGSGAMAVYLARRLPEARIYSVDSNPHALAMARRNVERHGVADRVTLLEGELLEGIPEMPDLVAASLAYADAAGSAAGQEAQPGLKRYSRLFDQLAERGWLVPLVLEVQPDQTEAMQDLLSQHFPHGETEIAPAYRGGARVVVYFPRSATDDVSLPGRGRAQR